MTTSTTEFLQEQKRLAEAWPVEQPEYMQYASEDLILTGNYDDAVREGFDAGVAWAEHYAKSPMLKLIAAVEAVMEALAFGDELDKTAHEYINPTARRLQIANRVLNRIEQRIEAALGGEGE